MGLWAKKGARLPDAISVTHPDRPVDEQKKRKATSDPAVIRRFMKRAQGR